MDSRWRIAYISFIVTGSLFVVSGLMRFAAAIALSKVSSWVDGGIMLLGGGVMIVLGLMGLARLRKKNERR